MGAEEIKILLSRMDEIKTDTTRIFDLIADINHDMTELKLQVQAQDYKGDACKREQSSRSDGLEKRIQSIESNPQRHKNNIAFWIGIFGGLFGLIISIITVSKYFKWMK